MLTNRLSIIGLIGIDGSGKTTQANLLLHSLKKDGNCAIYVHSFSRKTLADNLGVRSFIDIFINRLNEPSERRLVMTTKVVLRLGVIFLDSWLAFVAYNAKYGERLVVYDRYQYDNLVLLASSHIALANLILIFSKLLPRPKITILLKVGPKTAIERKSEHTYDDAKRICSLYEMLGQTLHIITVDAEQDMQSVRRQIKEILCRKILC